MKRRSSTRKVSDSENERAEGEILSNVFECPPDFEQGAYIPLGGLTVESAKASSTEIWLIQAPTDFSPQCLTGMTIPLEGFERVTLDKENKHYRIMSSCREMPKTGVVLPMEKGGNLQWAAVLKGMISVTEEAVGMANGSGKIHPVPVPPPPSIPEGLRQRFKPFGYSQPVGAQEHVADRKETTRKKSKLAVEPELVVKDEPDGRKRAKDKKSREKSRDETVPAAPLAVQVKVEPDEGDGKAHGRKKKKKNREKDREVAAPVVVDGSNLAVRVKEEGAEERNGNEASPEAATRSGGTESPLLRLQDAAGESEEGGKEEVKPKKKKKKSKKDRKEEAPLAAVEMSELSEGACAAVEIEQGSTESRSRKKKKKSRDKEKTAVGEGVCAADLIKNEADDGVEVKTEMESWDLIREEAASPSAYPCVVPKAEAEQNEPSVRRKKKKRRDKDADNADDAGGEGHVAAGTTSSRGVVAGDAGAADVEVADVAVDDTEPNPVKREDEKEARKKNKKKKKKKMKEEEEEEKKHVAVKREEPASDAAAVDEHASRKRSKHKQSEEEIPDADVGERVHKKKRKK